MTRDRIVLLIVVFVAFLLRVWELPHTPPGLWYDEAYNAMDARWMAQTGHYPPFLVGNNGREGMWPFLLMLATSLGGNTTFAVRWVGAIAGFITVPIIYRFARSVLVPFAANRTERRWLAVTAAGWLAVSWWHLLNSRAGFRPVLLPPVLMLCLYFWMAGVRGAGSKRAAVSSLTSYAIRFVAATGPLWRWRAFVLAGLFLGLSQYTYLPARLAPGIVGGLTILWTGLALLPGKKLLLISRQQSLAAIPTPTFFRHLWLGLGVTAIVAALIFTPLGLFFLQNPGALSARTGDVAFRPDTVSDLMAHFLRGVTLFFGAGHDLYRHHLPGRAMLGWLEIPFFWIGLFSLLRPANLRRVETHLLLGGLGLMWLPALLASPPVHALRPIGLLPFYYLIVTLGLFSAVRFTRSTFQTSSRLPVPSFLPVAAGIILAANGLLNTYDYFWRWANHPQVYQEYNGPLVDVTRQLIKMTETTDVIIPFHLYVHPTTRYLLGETFTEVSDGHPSLNRPVQMLLVPSPFQLLYVGNIPESPAIALLSRNESGQGVVSVSRPPRADEQTALTDLVVAEQPNLMPFKDKLGRPVAQFVPVAPQLAIRTLQPLFSPMPLRTIDVTWPGLVQLTGYEVTPELVRPGEPLTLNLYWHSLTNQTFEGRLFLQLIDSAGNPINQWEGDAFREDMYRWRPDGTLPTQHTLWLGPDTAPGPYLIRLGFFDEESGERLPVRVSESASQRVGQGGEAPVLDQVQLGLFYVTDDGTDPRVPETPLSANFADSINLMGTTFNLQPSTLPVTFHWQALRPTDRPYTVFLQLLDEQGQVVSGWDGQPFGGLYPTTLWSPGEIIVDTFLLPLPPPGLPPGPYRLVTGFYDFDTGRRLPVIGGSDVAELGRVVIEAP